MTLDDIEFHDLPVAMLKIDFDHGDFIIKVTPFSEETQNYFEKTLTFTKIANINMATLELNTLSDIEIFDLNTSTSQNGNRAIFLFLTGSGGLNCELAFDYSECQIT